MPCGALRVLPPKRPYGCFWGGSPAVFHPLDTPSRMGLAMPHPGSPPTGRISYFKNYTGLGPRTPDTPRNTLLMMMNSKDINKPIVNPTNRRLVLETNDLSVCGEFHDQGDAKWIVIRGPLRGHKDTPFGRPTPGRPIDRPGVGRPQGIFGGFSYHYQ